MKLRSVVVRRYDNLPNDCTVGMLAEDGTEHEFTFTPTEEDIEAIQFALATSLNAAMSKLFESLTGSDSPDVPTEQTQEPFLATEEEEKVSDCL